MANVNIVGEVPTQDVPDKEKTGWLAWLKQVRQAAFSVTQSGTTAQRPVTFLWVGRRYFDTTVGKPVWYNGTTWITWP